MNVLSLFDGMSCGQQALDRLGIKVDNYFASEIDKYAIQVTMANYPNTKQLGSVVNVDGYSLPKIDLLIGGSPCQSFSFAGKRKGMSTKDEQEILTLEHYLELKFEGYEFEGQSYLFWEYMRLLNEVKPKYFLLENVMMGEKWEKVLSKAIGVKPIEINSALVSAQNRRRLYWTNIGMQSAGLFGDMESIIQQPKDKGILLKDILESDVDEKYFLSDKAINGIIEHKKIQKEKGYGFGAVIKNESEKMNSLKIGGSGVDDLIITNNKRLNETIELHKDNLEHGTLIDSYNKAIHKDKSITISTRVRESNSTHIVHNTMPRSSKTGKGGTGPLSRADGKTYCLDTGFTNAVEIIGGDFRYDEGFRWRENGKSPILCLGSENGLSGNALAKINNSRIRRLTPIECERLQTVSDNYTNHVSDSQRYKMLGNGWTVDVIAHIFSYMK
jgi:DNA (cytosine-5)-methyltransferase 3A